MKKAFFFLLMAILLDGCSRSIMISYSHAPENNSTLILQPSKPVEKAFLTVNNQLLVDSKNVKKITISKLPQGDCRYQITSESSFLKTNLNETKTVNLQNGQVHTELIEVPPYNGAYYALLIGTSVISLASLLLF